MPIAEAQRRDLLAIVENRHARKSTILTSQLPMGQCGAAPVPWTVNRFRFSLVV